MPNVSSPLGTASSAMPLVRANALGQMAGVPMVFATLADLNAAIASERANIAGLGGLWSPGQPLGVANEVGVGITRVWDATAQHGRTVVLSAGKTATMPSDSNVVLSASGVPGALIGSAGDLSIDGTTGLVYALAGTWAPAGSISSASSAPATPVLAIANYTAGLLDFLIEVDSTAGSVLITLPDTAAYGHVFRIAWIAGSNAVTVTSTDTASRPIEGDDGLPHTSVTLSVVGEVVEHYRSAAIFKRA